MPSFTTTTPPKPSSLPKELAKLAVQLDLKSDLNNEDSDNVATIIKFQRAANYLSVAQIFLRDNFFLTEPLDRKHVKLRLLGHFGTCPGLNLVYAHLNALITRHEAQGDDIKSIYIAGPGHGAPAILACLYLEGAITKFYPQYAFDKVGLGKFIKSFSWPGGFPSHVNAETPGAIHEGGELGYALAVSYGAVMDDKDLIAVCVVGDGEAETGPTATAWHAHKFIDPAESGAVLPVLHLNGFKISERTILGTMDDLEVVALFTGYGYQVRLVEYQGTLDESTEEEKENVWDLNVNMRTSLEWAYAEIRKIQKAAREGNPIVKPRWPIIILRTPKGMSGPARLNDLPLVGSFRSHQVPLPEAGKGGEQLKLLEKWLRSYKPEELFDLSASDDDSPDSEGKKKSVVNEKLLSIVPKNLERVVGMMKVAYTGYQPLEVPEFEPFCVDGEASAMKTLAKYLADIVEKNPKSFRIFSPDEFASNKLDGVLEKTHRQFQWDPETANNGGRVIEMLSEHTLQGFLQGYTLTGRTGLFPSYEAFIGIVSTMIQQYAKFQKIAMETSWRGPVASMNYIETSTLWRQEHNGYSHQNPGFIGQLLTLPSNMVRIYLPPDANTMLSVMAHCLRSKNLVNLTIGSKAPTPVFLSKEEAQRHCVAGASVWPKFSTDQGANPDVVLVGVGVEVTIEAIAAAKLLQKEGVRVRLVNVVDLMVLGEVGTHPHALSPESFASLFGKDTPVVFNFHGYPQHLKSLVFSRHDFQDHTRFEVLGYIEQGTTTTPWSMLRLNRVGRFDVAEMALRLIVKRSSNHLIGPRAHELISWYKHQNKSQKKYVLEHGEDPPEMSSY